MAAIYSVVYPELVEVLLIFFADDFQFNRIPSPRKKYLRSSRAAASQSSTFVMHSNLSKNRTFKI